MKTTPVLLTSRAGFEPSIVSVRASIQSISPMAPSELSALTGIDNTMAWSPVATEELIVAPGDRFHIGRPRTDLRTCGDS
jgi:hypothetical protein